jgi:RHS repeat-associated protein
MGRAVMQDKLMRLSRAMAFAAGICLLTTNLIRAQQNPSANPPDTMPIRGFYPNGSYSIDDIEAVNNVTRNLTLSIPLAKLPPDRGGSSFGLNMVYNSAIFDLDRSIVSSDLQLKYTASSFGNWRYSYDYGINWDQRPTGPNATCEDLFYKYKAYLLMPDGNRKNLRLMNYPDNGGDSYYAVSPQGDTTPPCGGHTPPAIYSNTVLVYVTSDSSYIRVEVAPLQHTWTVFTPDGTQVSGTGWHTAENPKFSPSATAVETISDRNNNTITITQSCPDGEPCIRTIADDLRAAHPGRAIVITYGADAGGTQDTISWPGNNTTTINYTTVSLPNLTYTCGYYNGGTCSLGSFSFSAVSSIVLPVTKPGGPTLSYGFDYACPGCTTMWGELHTLTMPSGATVKYTYYEDGRASTARLAGEAINPIATKTVSYSPVSNDISSSTLHTKYEYGVVNNGPGTFITTPDGAVTSYGYFGPATPSTAGLPSSIEYPDGSMVSYNWAQNTFPDSSASAPANPYLRTVFKSSADNNAWARTDSMVDKNGNTLHVEAYDWVAGLSSGTLLRKTASQYYVSTPAADTGPTAADPSAYWNSSAPHYLRAVQATKVLDASDAVVAATQYQYDDFGSTANLLFEYDWDSTKAAYPGDPQSVTLTLSSTNAIVKGATYGTGGTVLSVTNPNEYPGKTKEVAYDADGLYPRSVIVANAKPEQRTTSFVFDSTLGLLKSATDDNNVTTNYNYDYIGRLTSVEQKAAAGTPHRFTRIDYDDVGLTVTSRQDKDTANDQALASTTYYDPLGRVRLTVDPAGGQAVTGYWYPGGVNYHGISYVANSNPYFGTSDSTMGWTLTTRSGASGSGQSWTYNPYTIEHYRGAGAPAPFGSNGGNTGQASSNSNGPAMTVVDEAGNSHSYTFDALGRLTSADGINYTYDPLGNLRTAGGTSGTATGTANVAAHDFTANQATFTVRVDGGAAQTVTLNRNMPDVGAYARAINGQLVGAHAIADSANPGRIAIVSNSTGASSTITLSDGTNAPLASFLHLAGGAGTPGADATRIFQYSSLSRLISASNPETGVSGGTSSYQYDNNGNLVAETDGRGITVCFGTWTLSGGGFCNWSTTGYDALNRPRQKTYSNGTSKVSYTYDADVKGTLSSVSNSVSTTSYTHDAFGRVTGSTQNTSGQEFPPFTYEYNLADFLTKEIYPSGRVVTYTPDSANRLSAITGATPTDVYANQLQITAFGAISSMRLGNGVTETLSWNDRLQQTGVQASNASAVTLLGLGFYPCPGQQAFCSTGNTGNILSQTIQMPSASFTQNYTYDRFHRLLTAQESGGWSQTNVYDKVGNRALLSGTEYYIPGGSWTPQVPANDPAQVAQMFPGNRWSGATYDGGTAVGAGNVTGLPGTAFGYDAENRLTSISLGATSFEYDGLDQRMKVNSTIYVYDAAGNLAAEYGQGESSLCGTPRCYVTVDHLGSTRLVTDDTGNAMRRYDYLPFGEELPAGAFGRTVERGYQSAPDGFNPKFTGQMRDMVSGLDYFNARYYNPAQGAFLSPDPWNAGANVADSQSWNGFSYVTNNPLNLVDPSGLDPIFSFTPIGNPSSSFWSNFNFSISVGPSLSGGWWYGPNPLLLDPKSIADMSARFLRWSRDLKGQAEEAPNSTATTNGACGPDGYRDATPEERASVLSIARANVGGRYRRGAGARSSPEAGFDCSGFVSYCIKGARIPYSYSPTSSMASNPALRFVGRSSAQPGDVVLFPGHTGFSDPGQSSVGSLLNAQSSATGVRYSPPEWFGKGETFRIRVKCR